jgi:uncharacterized membrane protein
VNANTIIGLLAVAASLAAFWFAWKLTEGKPTGRIAAMIGAVALSLLAVAVVYGFTNSGFSGRPTHSGEQPR